MTVVVIITVAFRPILSPNLPINIAPIGRNIKVIQKEKALNNCAENSLSCEKNNSFNSTAPYEHRALSQNTQEMFL